MAHAAPPIDGGGSGSGMGGGVDVAVVHEGEVDPLAAIEFRPLHEGDLAEVKALHEALFPVRYSQSFFDCAVRGYMCGTLQPLRTLVAVTRGEGGAGMAMVGVVIAQVLPTGECGDAELVWPEHAYTEVMYILTLGTLPEYRRLGLGKLLLQKALDSIDSPQCGAAYLHVITYNEAAIRFYEANGFKRLRTLQDYYVIEGQRYASYLYIRYLNRAMDPNAVTWINGLFRPFVDLARALSASLSALKTKRDRRPSGMATATATASGSGKVASSSMVGAEKGLEEKEQPARASAAPFSPSLSGKRRQAPAPLPPPPGPPPQLGHAGAPGQPAPASAVESIV